MEIIKTFNSLLKDGTIPSMNAAASMMDMSPAQLSQFLNNKYKGDLERTSFRISNYIKDVLERKKYSSEHVFIRNLTNTEMVLNVVRLTHLQRSIGLITGKSGLGKTSALKSYAEEHQEVLFIEVDTAYSPKELLSELHEMCGYNGKGHLNLLKKDIISKLKNSGRLLIIDQAEYLQDKALDLLRSIHDKAGVGLLLSGLPRLLNNIKGVGGVHEQIYTRIGAFLELKPLTDADITKLVFSYGEGFAGLERDFIELCRRNARVLTILARESRRIALNKGVTVNQDIIRTAFNQLVR